MSINAFFNERGDCLMIVSGKDEPMTACHEVEPGIKAREICLIDGVVTPRVPVDVGLPLTLEINEALALPEIPGCYWTVNGHADVETIIADGPGILHVRLNGPKSYEATIEGRSYVEARRAAYPPVVDQLDLIYHGGIEAWEAAIQAVKAQYPKPGE